MGIFSWRNSSKEKKKAETNNPDAEMSFLDHLEELRRHIFRGLIPIVLFAIGLFAFRQEVLSAVFMSPFTGEFPTYKLLCKLKLSETFCNVDIQIGMQALSPYEQFMKAMVFAFFGGIILAFPYLMITKFCALHAKGRSRQM